MVFLNNKEYAWISKNEINQVISSLKKSFKIYEDEVENKLLGFEKEYYSCLRRLKKCELSTNLFSDINSWIGSICYGIPEINFENENKMFGELCPNIVVGSMLEGEKDTKYYVTYIEPKHQNAVFITGI